LRINVQDTGIGIPGQEQRRIFEPFTQQNEQDTRRYGGTGLGLAISRRLVAAMGGTITVESVPGEGALFVVTIPQVEVVDDHAEVISTGDGQEAAAPVRGRERPDLTGLLVLIAEDDRVNRTVLREFLHAAGARIQEASDGSEVIRKAHEERPDLILMDIQMPVLDGREAARRLRNHSRTGRVPIIAITAGITDLAGDIPILFHAVLRKPVSRGDLERAIRTVAGVPAISGDSTGAVPSDATVFTRASGDHRKVPVAVSPSLRSACRSELRPEWLALRSAVNMPDLARFSGRLRELAGIHQTPVLADVSMRLDQFAERVQIEEILREIADLAPLFETIPESD
jgi:CheY-like chemotaxis protein